MMLQYHIWLYLSMSIIFWARVYLSFQKRRQDPAERKVDLIVNCIFALLFTIALIDFLMTIPQIINILEKIKSVV
jgi:hypothetical protein